MPSSVSQGPTDADVATSATKMMASPAPEATQPMR
jgi:hypothetical protein